MTLNDFKLMLLTIDPKVKKRFHAGKGENYTVWNPRNDSDDISGEQLIKIQVHRFTKDDNDSITSLINAELKKHDDIALPNGCETDYENDTEYIHHIWDCEVAV